jgi:hypothetical protein
MLSAGAANADVAPTAKYHPKRLFGDIDDIEALGSIPVTKTTQKSFGRHHLIV